MLGSVYGFLYIDRQPTRKNNTGQFGIRELEQEKRNSFPAWFTLSENECVIDIFSVCICKYIASSITLVNSELEFKVEFEDETVEC